MSVEKKTAVHWFAERTSMHGVPSLVKSRSTKSKVFWGCVCLIGMGMFIFMLISLITKYFSYPTVVKIVELPKGLVLPHVSFCNKRYSSLMSEIAVAMQAKAKHNGTDTFSLDMDKKSTSAFNELYNLLLRLDRLQNSLNDYENLSKKPHITLNANQTKFLKEWSGVKDYLSQRWLLTSLLHKHMDTGNDSGHLLSLEKSVQDLMVHCRFGHDTVCNESYVSSYVSTNSLQCYKYDLSEGRDIKETHVQGINNGLTFVFMTGANLLASEYEGLWDIPGLQNTFHPSVGSDGIQMMIYAPDMSPFPDLEGIDVSPGMATTIGITSKENIRLPHPYGDCSTEDIEGHLIMKSVKQKLGYEPREGFGKIPSEYSAGVCRETCLLRHIWEECGCLFPLDAMPFVNSSLFCGRINSLALFNPYKYGKEKCFETRLMLDEECIEFLEHFFSDLKCARKVTQMLNEEKEDVSKCNCPAACFSRDYEVTAGTSRWPSPGPETATAYNNIVQESVIPYLEMFNTSLTDGVIKYLSGPVSGNRTRAEIMENFARVTLYVKRLTVERVEQIADYTVVSLISDIGGQLGFWVGISAITLCEIFGFLSLAIKNCYYKSIKDEDDENENKKTPPDDSTEKCSDITRL